MSALKRRVISCIFFRRLFSQVPDTPEADPEEWKTAIAQYEAAAANTIVDFVLVNKRASTVNVISIDTILRRHLQSVTRIDISYNYLRNSGVISLAYVFKSLGTSCAYNLHVPTCATCACILHVPTCYICYMCLHPTCAYILRVPTFYMCLHSTCAYILRVLTCANMLHVLHVPASYLCLSAHHVPTCYKRLPAHQAPSWVRATLCVCQSASVPAHLSVTMCDIPAHFPSKSCASGYRR